MLTVIMQIVKLKIITKLFFRFPHPSSECPEIDFPYDYSNIFRFLHLTVIYICIWLYIGCFSFFVMIITF